MCASLRSVAIATAMGESDRKRSNRRNKWVRVGRRKAKVGERREKERTERESKGVRRKEEGPKTINNPKWKTASVANLTVSAERRGDIKTGIR